MLYVGWIAVCARTRVAPACTQARARTRRWRWRRRREGKGNGAVVAFGFAFDSIQRALSSLPAPRVCTRPEPRDTPVSASREPLDTIREAEAEKRSKPRYAARFGRRDWWPATGGQRADKERRGGFVTFAFPLSFFPRRWTWLRFRNFLLDWNNEWSPFHVTGQNFSTSNFNLYNSEKVAISVRRVKNLLDGRNFINFEMLSDSFRYIRRLSIREKSLREGKVIFNRLF